MQHRPSDEQRMTVCCAHGDTQGAFPFSALLSYAARMTMYTAHADDDAGKGLTPYAIRMAMHYAQDDEGTT